MKRKWKIAGLVLLLAVGAIAVAIAMTPLVLIARHAANLWLGRTMEFEALDVTWGREIKVEARGLRIANPDWAKAPDYLRIGTVSAVIDAASLWTGPVILRQLHARDVEVDLEHGADGARNWRPPGVRGTLGGGPTIDRTNFPTVEDGLIETARVRYRARSGRTIDVALSKLTLAAADADAPVKLSLDGTLNNVAVHLEGPAMASFRALHDSGTPYKAALDFRSAPIAMHYDGTFIDPLNFDGLAGALKVEAPVLKAALEMFGAGTGPRAPLSLTGTLKRTDRAWTIDDVHGAYAGMAFTGPVKFDEAEGDGLDRLHLHPTFPRLDIDKALQGSGPRGAAAANAATTTTGVDVDGELHATTATWQGFVLSSFAMRGTLADQTSATATFGFYGGSGQGRIDTPSKGHSTFSIYINGGDFDRLAQLAGIPAGTVAGSIESQMLFAMSGVGADLSVASGRAVASVHSGSMARKLLESASTDLRALFRDRRERIAIDCAVLVAELNARLLTLPLIRLDAAGVALAGGGQIDLARRTIDISIRPRGGALALDLPLRISGAMANPSIAPGAAPAPAHAVPALPTALQTLLAATPCRQ